MVQPTDRSNISFVHDPLPTPTSIRLLRRLGRNDEGQLNYALDIVDLQDQPQYHCLSYSWGNPHANGNGFHEAFEAAAAEYGINNLNDICVNGKVCKVRRNLYDALCEISTKEGWVHRIINRPYPETKRTRLHDKAEEGTLALVRAHIVQGANVNAKDALGRIPLHYAALNGHLEVTMLLVKADSDVSTADNDRKTPKDLAVVNRHHDIENFLTACLLDDGKEISEGLPDFSEYGPDDRIWIDAICIDQQNLEERAAQVSIMDMVYSNARYMIAWLGRKDKTTVTALETMAKLISSGDNLSKSSIVPYRTQLPEEYKKAQIPYISQGDWDALASLLLRQWFRRIWVIQEVVFATGILIYCGDSEIQWGDIARVMSLLAIRYSQLGYEPSKAYIPLTEVATSIEYYYQILYGYRESRFELESSDSATRDHFSLIELIKATYPFLTTDPKDKIFALFSLFTLYSKVAERLRPDYSKSTEELYSEMTKKIILSGVDLQVLSIVQDKSVKRIDQLPSWVPDYSLQGTGPLPSYNSGASGELHLIFNAQFYFSDWHELQLKGIELDVIVAEAGLRPIGGPNQKLHLDESWFDLILTMNLNSTYHDTEQSLSEALWRTLCADTASLYGEKRAPLEYGAMFKTFICALVCAEPERLARAEANDKENAIRLGALLQAALRTDNARTFIRPDDTYMARLRSNIEPEDRSISSPFLDCVRLTLTKLDAIAVTRAGDYIPTSNEVAAYFQRSINPLTGRRGLVEIPPQIAPFVHAHSDCYGRRRLFVTKGGYLGLGPVSLQAGDAVWILPGAKVPFLLRPAARSGSGSRSGKYVQESRKFELVGEAYVHGMMQGEAVQGKSEMELKMEEITLI